MDDEIEVKIGGLAFGCPFKQRLCTCPFRYMDTSTFEEKINLSQEFDYEKKKRMVQHHFKCLKKRESKRICKRTKLLYA